MKKEGFFASTSKHFIFDSIRLTKLPNEQILAHARKKKSMILTEQKARTLFIYID